MNNAFRQGFDEGFHKVLVMMPDCPKMSDTLIEKAFKSLDENDVVIGPTDDKGFYMLGMKKYIPDIFKNKTYETATQYEDTVKTFENLGLKYFNLPVLVDIDMEEDLGKLKKIIDKTP